MNSYFSYVIFIWFHGFFVKFRYFIILKLIIFNLSYSLNLWYSLNYRFPAYSKILTPPIFVRNLTSFNYFVGLILGFLFIIKLFVETFYFTMYLQFLFALIKWIISWFIITFHFFVARNLIKLVQSFFLIKNFQCLKMADFYHSFPCFR